MMGVPERGDRRTATTIFRNMLGLVRGRVYYNLLQLVSPARAAARLPASTARFMEQMMGVKEALPDAPGRARSRRDQRGQRADGRASTCRARWRAWSRTTSRSIAAIAPSTSRLDDALAPPAPPLADRRPDELVAHYRDLRRRLLLTLGRAARQRLLRDDLLRRAAQPGDARGAATRRARCRTT